MFVTWLGVFILRSLIELNGGLVCLAEETATVFDISTALPEDRGIEEKILGPFRTWHIIFTVVFIVIAIIVVICCCHSFRIPRTRQEIEENFQKRVINRDYVRLLERNPDKVVRKAPVKVSTTVSSGQMHVKRATPVRSAKGDLGSHTPDRDRRPHAQSSKPSSSHHREEEDDTGEGVKPYRPLAAAKAARLGAATPLALNPKDILALMAKQRQASGDA